MLQKSSMQLITDVFYRFPTKEHTLKDVSNCTKIAHTSVKQNLQKLVRIELIQQKIEKKGRRKFPLYIANKNNRLLIQYKQIYNLQSIMESGIIQYLEEELMPKCILVFGSYQRGEDIEDSDIDLFVESKKKELKLRKFEEKLGRKIEIHFNEHFTSYPIELKNNIINGTVLHGFLEGYT
ncbi:nucleotidyltransferase domain-containing protein [Candidatus Woesearchaeota archaeon]|nr:nucleotidyltransferase domain-containing protein [Candidatus Woesearchaeota archaeon]